MADMPSHITGFWSVLEESIPLLSVSLRPAGHIRSEFIWHPLDIPYLAKKCPFKLQGQTLHAGILGFEHPSTGEYVDFKADLPEYFEDLIKKLKLLN